MHHPKIKVGIILLSLIVSAAAQTVGATGQDGRSAANQPALGPQAFPRTAFAALGSSFVQGSHLTDLGWNEDQVAAFIEGVRAAFQGKGYAFDETARQLSAEMGRRVHELETPKQQQAAEAMAKPGQFARYIKDMRKHVPLQMSDSGLAYFIQPGKPGVRPRLGDTVVVSCNALAADAKTKLPQLSNDHIRVKLEGLVPGFMEGLQMMTVDGEAMFVLPPSLSFGEGEWPEGVDRGMPLIFQVTLHEVISTGGAP